MVVAGEEQGQQEGRQRPSWALLWQGGSAFMYATQPASVASGAGASGVQAAAPPASLLDTLPALPTTTSPTTSRCIEGLGSVQQCPSYLAAACKCLSAWLGALHQRQRGSLDASTVQSMQQLAAGLLGPLEGWVGI